MPYRINPKNPKEVQVKKGGRWIREHLHQSSKKAALHLAALRKNVKHK